MQKFFSVILVLVALSWCNLFAQQESSAPQVFQSIYNDTSPPLRDMVNTETFETFWKDGIIPWREIPADDQPYEKDPGLQDFYGTKSGGTIIENFDGVPAAGFAPPDQTGAVGPNHYMQMVNVRYQIWDKTGTSLVGPFNLGTLWAGFPGPWQSSLNDGDPVVLYDQAADRFFASQFSLPNGGSGPEYILVAISQTGDPTGSWHRYGFAFPQFPDYPHYGIWPDGYYMSVNRFAPSFTGTYAAAFERAQMLVGNPAQLVFFTNGTSMGASFLPSDWDGVTPPPAGAPNYFTALNSSTSLRTYEFHVDWVTPANSTFGNLIFTTVNAYSQINNIQQLGTSQTLDGLADRLMQRQQYRNFGSHQSMVTCHSVDAGGSRAGVRWYELRNTGAGWTLFQQGTYAPADGHERWMGSIAMNGSGSIAMGYSVSSTTINPQIRYTGRFNGDPLGTMTVTEGTIIAGTGSQTGGLSRWGDYSHISVDPVDDHTFWYTNEYLQNNGSFNWRTRIASFQLAPIPVELTSFTANSLNDEVELNWSTATETNNQGFEVQRKSSNTEFAKVGYVAGFGTTTEPHSYTFTDANMETGSYTYRLKQMDFDGSFEYSPEVAVEVTSPIEYALEQNYPNPFNPSTMIKYSIPQDGFVKLAIYNMLGEEVALLVNNQQNAGRYDVEFNATGFSSGVYVYKLETSNYTASKKLMLMK